VITFTKRYDQAFSPCPNSVRFVRAANRHGQRRQSAARLEKTGSSGTPTVNGIYCAWKDWMYSASLPLRWPVRGLPSRSSYG
jgi:hypothetical protein